MDPQACLTEQQKADQQLKAIYDRINVRRTIINNKRYAPKGYIFYEISFKTDNGSKYTGSRLIDLARENAIGGETIVINIKRQIIEKHWPLEFKLAKLNQNADNTETETHGN